MNDPDIDVKNLYVGELPSVFTKMIQYLEHKLNLRPKILPKLKVKKHQKHDQIENSINFGTILDGDIIYLDPKFENNKQFLKYRFPILWREALRLFCPSNIRNNDLNTAGLCSLVRFLPRGHAFNQARLKDWENFFRLGARCPEIIVNVRGVRISEGGDSKSTLNFHLQSFREWVTFFSKQTDEDISPLWLVWCYILLDFPYVYFRYSEDEVKILHSILQYFEYHPFAELFPDELARRVEKLHGIDQSFTKNSLDIFESKSIGRVFRVNYGSIGLKVIWTEFRLCGGYNISNLEYFLQPFPQLNIHTSQSFDKRIAYFTILPPKICEALIQYLHDLEHTYHIITDFRYFYVNQLGDAINFEFQYASQEDLLQVSIAGANSDLITSSSVNFDDKPSHSFFSECPLDLVIFVVVRLFGASGLGSGSLGPVIERIKSIFQFFLMRISICEKILGKKKLHAGIRNLIEELELQKFIDSDLAWTSQHFRRIISLIEPHLSKDQDSDPDSPEFWNSSFQYQIYRESLFRPFIRKILLYDKDTKLRIVKNCQKFILLCEIANLFNVSVPQILNSLSLRQNFCEKLSKFRRKYSNLKFPAEKIKKYLNQLFNNGIICYSDVILNTSPYTPMTVLIRANNLTKKTYTTLISYFRYRYPFIAIDTFSKPLLGLVLAIILPASTRAILYLIQQTDKIFSRQKGMVPDYYIIPDFRQTYGYPFPYEALYDFSQFSWKDGLPIFQECREKLSIFPQKPFIPENRKNDTSVITIEPQFVKVTRRDAWTIKPSGIDIISEYGEILEYLFYKPKTGITDLKRMFPNQGITKKEIKKLLRTLSITPEFRINLTALRLSLNCFIYHIRGMDRWDLVKNSLTRGLCDFGYVVCRDSLTSCISKYIFPEHDRLDKFIVTSHSNADFRLKKMWGANIFRFSEFLNIANVEQDDSLNSSLASFILLTSQTTPPPRKPRLVRHTTIPIRPLSLSEEIFDKLDKILALSLENVILENIKSLETLKHFLEFIEQDIVTPALKIDPVALGLVQNFFLWIPSLSETQKEKVIDAFSVLPYGRIYELDQVTSLNYHEPTKKFGDGLALEVYLPSNRLFSSIDTSITDFLKFLEIWDFELSWFVFEVPMEKCIATFFPDWDSNKAQISRPAHRIHPFRESTGNFKRVSKRDKGEWKLFPEEF